MSYPDECNKYLKFKNSANGLRTGFTIYCDFESILVPVDDEKGRKISKHIPCGVGCLTTSDCQVYNQEQIWTHSGPDTMTKFFEYFDKESARINEILNDPKPMSPMTAEEELRYRNTKNCGNCDIEFDHDLYRRVECPSLTYLQNSSTAHIMRVICCLNISRQYENQNMEMRFTKLS